MINVIDYIAFQLIKYTKYVDLPFITNRVLRKQGKECSYYTALEKEPSIQVYFEDAYSSC